jgi:putative glycosyltransferase (TIGR04372 family)
MGYFAPLRILTILGAWLFKRPLNNEVLDQHTGFDELWNPTPVDGFSWEIARSMDWDSQIHDPLAVALPREDQAQGERGLRALGIPKGAWYACVHVREGGFYGDHGASDRRNADIGHFRTAFKSITDRGGYVVRLGDATMKRLEPMERVIDYPFSPQKSELMDVYLISECRFYLGMQTGPLDTAALFQKPMVLVNMVTWMQWYLLRKGDIGTIKHVYSRSRGRFLSIQEVLTEPFQIQNWLTTDQKRDDYVFHENTPNEIDEAVREFLRAQANLGAHRLSARQNRFNLMRQRQTEEFFKKPLWPTPWADTHQK